MEGIGKDVFEEWMKRLMERIDRLDSIISVAQAAIRLTFGPLSLRALIRQRANLPMIWSPSTMKPPPKTSDMSVKPSWLPLRSKTFGQLFASVAHGPLRSRASAWLLASSETDNSPPNAIDFPGFMSIPSRVQ